ncbi:MAG: flagellin [Nitratireductor sp.]|nr:flagellin [Nitratireductor sp.]MCC0019922.1 flagellin [Nitratireductor sp.]
MTSINTNTAAMTALKSLQMTNAALDRTQSAISTGYSVSSAKDNAAYWSIATTMRSDNKALGTVQDALGLGAAKLDTAYTGMNAAIDVVDEIKSKLVAAREPGVDRSKIQAEVKELQNQLNSISESATFSGENWLKFDDAVATASEKLVASFNRSSTGAVSVSTITIDTGKVKLLDSSTDKDGILDKEFTTTGAGAVTTSVFKLDITAANVDTTDIDNMITNVDTALKSMTTAASNLGSAQKRVDLQSDFVGNLMDAIDRGIGQLVDADMSEESTKLQALQTQQQLGIQALSIANSASQNVLALFR